MNKVYSAAIYCESRELKPRVEKLIKHLLETRLCCVNTSEPFELMYAYPHSIAEVRSQMSFPFHSQHKFTVASGDDELMKRLIRLCDEVTPFVGSNITLLLSDIDCIDLERSVAPNSLRAKNRLAIYAAPENNCGLPEYLVEALNRNAPPKLMFKRPGHPAKLIHGDIDTLIEATKSPWSSLVAEDSWSEIRSYGLGLLETFKELCPLELRFRTYLSQDGLEDQIKEIKKLPGFSVSRIASPAYVKGLDIFARPADLQRRAARFPCSRGEWQGHLIQVDIVHPVQGDSFLDVQLRMNNDSSDGKDSLRELMDQSELPYEIWEEELVGRWE